MRGLGDTDLIWLLWIRFEFMAGRPRIVVVGLGYVGLPLAVALSRHFDVVGFDRDTARVAEVKDDRDTTGEVDAAVLEASSLEATADPAAIAGADVYIIAVPTPVDGASKPDLGAIAAACETVGAALSEGAIVVLESTVYPGVTERVCGPILERISGLASGRDFFLGYSPERINPGDREHTVERITKVVAGQTAEVTARLTAIYGAITNGNVFAAADIRTAEAAKVIENAQRDINIAFINEVTQIFGGMGISIHDVLEAARTKWNFLPFTPGLVGGHCIGVDPYYLAHAAQEAGLDPEIVLAGRRINDSMATYVADLIDGELEGASRILVLGLTFKENVRDLRNTKVIDIVRRLAALGHEVAVHDPLADAREAERAFGLALEPEIGDGFDCLVGCVAHAAYDGLAPQSALRPGGLVADVKGMWRGVTLPEGFRYWSL